MLEKEMINSLEVGEAKKNARTEAVSVNKRRNKSCERGKKGKMWGGQRVLQKGEGRAFQCDGERQNKKASERQERERSLE